MGGCLPALDAGGQPVQVGGGETLQEFVPKGGIHIITHYQKLFIWCAPYRVLRKCAGLRQMESNQSGATAEMSVELKYPRGRIQEARIDLQDGDQSLGWNFRAWIYLGGQTVEFLQGATGSRDVETWYPFEDHDTYRNAGRAYSREDINSFDDWQTFIKEYAANMDPRDVFRYRREEGL